MKDDIKTPEEYFGRRTKMVCGKICQNLHKEIIQMLGKEPFVTMNDFVEKSLVDEVLLQNKEKAERC